MKKKLTNLSLVALVLFLIGTLSIFLLNNKIKRSTQPTIYNTLDKVPNKHTVIVLGASVKSNGNLSVMLRDRVESALLLYNKGKVKRFLLSGDNGEANYNEPKAMKKYLIERGVNEDHIYLDYAGFDTYDSMYRAKEIFEVDEAIIVTQGFHLPRAVFLAQEMGLNYIGYRGDKRIYQHEDYNIKREFLANVKAYLELAFRKEPTYLGTKIPIKGPPQSFYEK